MIKSLGFSRKILLAAALIVVVAFSCFILVNDYRQRETLKNNVDAELQQLGSLTTQNIQIWLDSRTQLLYSMAQQIAADGPASANLQRTIGLPVYPDNFQLSYFGGKDGVMIANAIQVQFGKAANWPLGAALSVTTMVVVTAMAGAAVFILRSAAKLAR